jgi:tetratricopeptide (TPR) repeat protein
MPGPSEELRALHSEHHREALDAMVRLLDTPGPAPAVLLSGEPGSGRTGLLAAAASTPVIPLDLEGYEEGMDTLEKFARHQLARRSDLDETGRAALLARVAPLFGHLKPTLTGAALVSLLLRLDARLTVPGSIFAEPDARRALSLLLQSLSGSGGAILHVTASEQLSDTLRRRLLDDTRRHPGLVLALSCSPGDPDDRVAPRAERVRLELAPLPGAAALEPAKRVIDELDLQIADRLQRFLDLAALCGENVPADVLFHHLELEEEQREELLDAIDETLVEEQPLLLDHQYGHPSFPGLLTYSFRSPLFNRGLLEPLRGDKRERLASELLEFLDRSVPLATRGMTLLRLSLASHLDDSEAREPLLRELRWAIDEDETEELATEVAADLEAGTLEAGDLLDRVRETQARWPPHRRSALLEAVSRRADGLSEARRADLHILRAEVLRDLGKLPEALEESRRGLDIAREAHGPEHPEVARALNTAAVLLREAGSPEEARENLERALAIQAGQDGLDGLDGLDSAAIHANLALVLRDLGRRDEARDHLERALTVHRRHLGDFHPMVATDLGNLAAVSRELGDSERSLHYLQPVVDIVRRLYGDTHPQTSRALSNVAGTLRDLGRGEEARRYLEAALEIDRAVFGDRHPAVAASLNNLSLVERELGDADTARTHLEEAAEIATAALGPDHALTAQLRRVLAGGPE